MPGADQDGKPRRQWAPDARALSVVGDRWVMVIVRDLASGPLRLEALRRWLPGVSAGALESRLARMAEAGLITRRRRRSLPPRVDLELTERGHALIDAIGELARWELRTHWSCPRDDEWVDVGACFRLAPLLPRRAATADGRLALTITDASDDGPEHYTFVREHGRARIERNDTNGADARMSGTQTAWVKALSPERAPSSLQITGDPDLAAEFLDLFKV
jgi:DNA-binding HxlR family transcriptional regulator